LTPLFAKEPIYAAETKSCNRRHTACPQHREEYSLAQLFSDTFAAPLSACIFSLNSYLGEPALPISGTKMVMIG
jgi:hypothetical protein